MDEIVVEGLNYEDFVFVKEQLLKTTFNVNDLEEVIKTKDIINKLDQIIDAFN